MSVRALITEGIGPGGSIKYVMTGGLDISSVVPSIWTSDAPPTTTWHSDTAPSNVWTNIANPTTTWTNS